MDLNRNYQVNIQINHLTFWVKNGLLSLKCIYHITLVFVLGLVTNQFSVACFVFNEVTRFC